MQLLAIGAHPDDIEIGAAAFISKAIGSGAQTYFLVLSDESGQRAARRAEATRAAGILGVPPGQVLFAGLRDGSLRADGRSVTRVREIVADVGLKPDLIVTHTAADSHNDHIEACRIAHAAFRRSVFLHFSVYLSSEREQFAPRIFVGVSGERLEKKTEALGAYESQRSRLERRDLAEYEARLGSLARMERAEAFEVSRQDGAEGLPEAILELSESPFHRFWSQIVENKEITLFYEAYTTPGAPIDWPTSHASDGRDQLRQAFRDQWLPHSPLRETGSASSSVRQILESQSVILVGGAVSNLIVRDLYNRFRATVWAVDYEMPRQEPAYMYNRKSGQRHYPSYDTKGNVLQDYGIISRIVNPYATSEHVICAAGATGLGTRVALEFLADPGSSPEFLKNFDAHRNVQLMFSVEPGNQPPEVLDVCHG
jgi:LmbE family N-acetylglucosaminyl deacetylase